MVETLRSVDSLSEVNLEEWDLLVTDRQFISTTPYRSAGATRGYSRAIPPSMNIFGVLGHGTSLLSASWIDFANASGNDQPQSWPEGAPFSMLLTSERVPGHQVRRVNNLPETIQELVQSDLSVSIEERGYQYGFTHKVYKNHPSGFKQLRPFLIGPDDLILAGSYERIDGGSGWLIPADVHDPAAWFSQALLDWHRNQPSTFPAVAHWEDSEAWMTGAERAVNHELKERSDDFQRFRDEYEAHRQRLTADLEGLRVSARVGRRALLTAQDDLFQNAAFEALCALGFEVEDMDTIWPDRERREDFRIRDADQADWMVIGDATGVAKGAKGAKLQALAGYVTKYVLSDKPDSEPGQWLIVNRLIERDPETRGDVFRKDELEVFADAGGLAIDSAALFVLAEWADDHTSSKPNLRAHLREITGQLTLQMARDWIAAQ